MVTIKIKPNLRTKDLSEKHLKVAMQYLKEISSRKEVIGVAVGGGLGRGHADKFSDIDVYVFVDSKTFERWNRTNEVKSGCYKYRGYPLEVYLFDLPAEKKKTWLVQDRWERHNFIILFDTKGEVRSLLKEKCRWYPKEKEESLKELIMRVDWYLDLAENFIERGDLTQSHYHINHAVDWILDIVFLNNSYFIPWDKWKLHYACLMNKEPTNFKSKIQELMKINSFTEKEVKRRVEIGRGLLKELK